MEQETDQLSIAVAMFLFVISMQVGVKSIETGVWGAYQNVLINLKDVKEDDVRQKVGIFFGRFFCMCAAFCLMDMDPCGLISNKMKKDNFYRTMHSMDARLTRL